MHWFRIGLLSLLGLVVVFALALAMLWPYLLPRLVYMAHPLPPEHRSPAVWRYTGEEVFFRSADGIELHGWYLPAEAESCGTALFLHGNAGNLASHAGFAPPLLQHGLDVFLFDYRGYGASDGTPTEEGLYRDAEAAYDYLRGVRRIPQQQIVLVGHSLGSAVATELATRRPAAALVLAAPFTSLPRALQAFLPWFPVGFLRWESERFDALSDLEQLEVPVLMALGRQDRLVPARDARALFAAASEPKVWVDVAGGHNQVFHGAEFRSALSPFLAQTLGCSHSPQAGPG